MLLGALCITYFCCCVRANEIVKPELFDVLLMSFGENEKQGIDVACKISGCPVERVEQQLRGPLKIVRAGLKNVVAEQAIRALEAVGCKAELRPAGMYSIAELFGCTIKRRLKWPANHRNNDHWVFNTVDQVKSVWKEDGGRDEDCPKFNQENESIVALFMTPQETHGQPFKVEMAFCAGDAEGQRLTLLYREIKEELATPLAGEAIVISPKITMREGGKDFYFSAYNLNSEKGKELTRRFDWNLAAKERKEEK